MVHIYDTQCNEGDCNVGISKKILLHIMMHIKMISCVCVYFFIYNLSKKVKSHQKLALLSVLTLCDVFFYGVTHLVLTQY